ncbi:maleylacetate reductase [Enteractinococcus helveticum]|uniref:Maleylacetate reductase n=1 Tax=Enteractinococcus helveticum TaxID=1837282 RepID=A0A1B7M0K5_9MICC|nr:maleylacetate reductase [Enteractinococcus helveticum]OAV61786.1 maleylacetate reductase [Enteractinococcus helveticum]
MSLVFEHVSLGQRVLFGNGKAADYLAQEVRRLKARRIMLIASDRAQPAAQQITAQIEVLVNYTQVVMHVPFEVAQHARAVAREYDVDVLVCVGGGSATGLAKAIALDTGLPIIAVPTTYSGSEATNMWGLTVDARKTTGVNDAVLPKTVIYDAEFTMELPVELSVASGLNGMAHCIDSLWGPRADPINQALATEGITALAAGLPSIVDDPQDLAGREQLLYGAYLSAVSFASAGSGLHHKICHVLGGTFDLPHAQTHATVLAYVLAFNMDAAPEASERIARALGATDALAGFQRLRKQLDAPVRLADYGFTQDNIAEAVEIILPVVPANNPRPVTRDNLTALLNAALVGDDPIVVRKADTAESHD